jgi:aminoglycoside phosphotransferase (APT) family kinase protein
VTILVQRLGRLVARVDTSTGPVVVKADAVAGSLVGEVGAIRRLDAAGLPVPQVLASVDGPPAYVLLRWIEGEALSSSAVASAQVAAGRALRRVHSLGGGPPYPGGQSWDAWMTGWLNHALGWWCAAVDPGEDRVRGFRRWFDSLRPLLETRGRDLMLFDGRPEHLLVRNGELVGLIDLGEVRSGDAAMDLAVLAVGDPALLAGVLRGYLPTPAERAAFDRLVPFYLFLRRLASAEWNLTNGDPELTRHALNLVDRTPVPPLDGWPPLDR